MKVLHVISSFGRGGAPALIVNYMQELSKENIIFDFLLRSNNNAYPNEIKKCGGKVYVAPDFPKKIFSNIKYTAKFIKNHPEYKIIHLHCNALIYIIPAIIAKVNGRKVIIHSHNTKSESSLGEFIHKLNRLWVKNYSDVRLACSDLAGKWLFKRNYILLKNAIYADKFVFDKKARKRIREELQITNKRVYIHVGRFERQKNHDFLIDIFKEICRKDENSVLLLLGTGSLEDEIRKKVNNLGLSNQVFFCGIKSNVIDYLSASDLLLFPSLWEGLPVSLVEAQYSNLKVICSTNISSEVLASPYIKAISLNETAEKWSEYAIDFVNEVISDSAKPYLDDNGYNIKVESKKLKKIYNKLME